MHSFESICERYGITKGALSQYLKPRIEIINKDDEHIIRSGQKMYFDDVAIKRLDKMRNFNSSIELAQEVAEKEAHIAVLQENKVLRAKIEKLQQEKIQALADVATAYKQLESVRENYVEVSKIMRLESAQDKAAATAAKEQAAAAAAEKEKIQQELQAAMQDIGKYKGIAQVNADEAAQAKAALAHAQEQQVAAERKIAELQAVVERATQELKQEKQKSWWQKLFGR
ncbi:MAG: hypothetical protein ACI3WU_03185 [Phascolarctobacterium sp.]